MPERLNAVPMAYLSLYRKYRSQSFEDLHGQEHVVRTLQNALRAGRIGHAYLLSGPRGTGKTSTARLLARSLNCERGPTATPCGECVACQEIRDGISPSVVEIDAASSRGIDEVRDLRQRALTVPSQPGARKVFIVDEVHMLTTEACNALLKTLEEPPSHVLFILATTDAQKLPATILSRCQRFEFRRGSVSLIGERIRHVAESEGTSIEPEAVRLLSRASGGSWRDAISLLEQVMAYGGAEVTAAAVTQILGAVGEETLLELADGLARADGRTVYPIVERLISDGTEPRQLARDLGEHFRALLMADAGALPTDAYSPETTHRLSEQATAFGTTRLVAALEALAQAEKEMRWSDSGRVVLEVALARLMLGAPEAIRSPTTTRTTGDGARPTAAVSEGTRPAVVDQVSDRRPPLVEVALQTALADRPEGLEERAATQPLSEPKGAAVTRETTDEPEPSTDEYDPFAQEELPEPGVRGRAAHRGASDEAKSTTSEPADAPAASSEPGGLDWELLRARWTVLIEELKRGRSATTAALLAEAQPVRCDAQQLVIGFRHGTHRDMWERGDHKKRLTAALQSVFGTALPVRSEEIKEPGSGNQEAPGEGTDGRSPAASRRPSAAVAASRTPDPETGPGAAGALEGETLLHEVIALFDGQIVDQETK